MGTPCRDGKAMARNLFSWLAANGSGKGVSRKPMASRFLANLLSAGLEKPGKEKELVSILPTGNSGEREKNATE